LDRIRSDVHIRGVHGADDQIVPIADSAMSSAKLVKGSTLTIYPGAPHRLAETMRYQLNTDLLAFIRG
jgi:non-heme chloroperoxidase